MPKVSAIIPAYNALRYLPKTIDSILNQTFDDFEVIVINDGSTDETEKWVAQIADARVKLICQKNQGLAAARNTGIKHAKGKYLAFLDADDLWEPTKLEKQVQVLEQNPEVGLVYTWVAYIDEKGESTGRVVQTQAEGYVWKKLVERNLVECGSVAMVRSSCLVTVGLFDENLSSFNVGEDWDMWLRIAAQYPFKVIKEPLVYYRQRLSSASKNWEVVEQSFRLVIEKTFVSAPPELLYLKGRSYGFAYFCLAWKALQSCDRDYQKAAYYRSQALKNYAGLRFSKENFRLCVAISIMRWFGPNGYDQFLSLLYTLRRRTVALAR
ncbi:glycosyltransferase family 2 protein [Pleurocapsales cyanobacterium LEGE 06147]|nr:glycosyltransferase family 2 protein [Pleurocapsales cyanobacterium LEGE 06147]